MGGVGPRKSDLRPAQPGAVQEHLHQGAEIGDIEFFTISCN